MVCAVKIRNRYVKKAFNQLMAKGLLVYPEPGSNLPVGRQAGTARGFKCFDEFPPNSGL